MVEMTPELIAKIARLPVWAQDLIRFEQRTNDELRADIAMLHGSTPSRVNSREFMGDPRPLGDYVHVSFDLKDGGSIDVSLDNDNTSIRVSAGLRSVGKSAIRIAPGATNCFNVYVER